MASSTSSSSSDYLLPPLSPDASHRQERITHLLKALSACRVLERHSERVISLSLMRQRMTQFFYMDLIRRLFPPTTEFEFVLKELSKREARPGEMFRLGQIMVNESQCLRLLKEKLRAMQTNVKYGLGAPYNEGETTFSQFTYSQQLLREFTALYPGIPTTLRHSDFRDCAVPICHTRFLPAFKAMRAHFMYEWVEEAVKRLKSKVYILSSDIDAITGLFSPKRAKIAVHRFIELFLDTPHEFQIRSSGPDTRDGRSVRHLWTLLWQVDYVSEEILEMQTAAVEKEKEAAGNTKCNTFDGVPDTDTEETESEEEESEHQLGHLASQNHHLRHLLGNFSLRTQKRVHVTRLAGRKS